MHLTCWSVPRNSRWRMMASMAMAVLPVCRSPMISSRCPRPMAVMASIAVIPVYRGSFTGWRWTTDGAWSSSTRVSSDSMSPLPSMGRPRGSMTRPRKASPTGTDKTRPVRRTSSPSSLFSLGLAGNLLERELQPAPDGSVDDLVADAGHHAPHHLGVHGDLEIHVPPRYAGERSGQPASPLRVELDRRARLHHHAAAPG